MYMLENIINVHNTYLWQFSKRYSIADNDLTRISTNTCILYPISNNYWELKILLILIVQRTLSIEFDFVTFMPVQSYPESPSFPIFQWVLRLQYIFCRKRI